MNVDLEACEEDQDTLKGRRSLIELRKKALYSFFFFADFRLPSFEPEEPVSRRLTRSVDRSLSSLTLMLLFPLLQNYC